jgi:hypothetical protein
LEFNKSDDAHTSETDTYIKFSTIKDRDLKNTKKREVIKAMKYSYMSWTTIMCYQTIHTWTVHACCGGRVNHAGFTLPPPSPPDARIPPLSQGVKGEAKENNYVEEPPIVLNFSVASSIFN